MSFTNSTHKLNLSNQFLKVIIKKNQIIINTHTSVWNLVAGQKHNELYTHSTGSAKRDPLKKTSANEVRVLGPPPLTEPISVLTPQGPL